jgi:3-hydroxyisobutyrate dehydrogenase-like beta-hydroxyacid dehydrogenase
MAFNATNLVYSNWWTMDDRNLNRMWDYDAGADNIATVDGANYFNSAAKIVRQTDCIRVTASDGKAIYAVLAGSLSSGSETVNIRKLAAGVTSFPT